MQDIYLVAAPLNHRAYNKEKDENMDKMRKRRFLQKVEGISVIKKAAKSQNSKEEKLKRELWETMIATFMNNIQLQIHRVHIRFEDSTTIPGTTISAGLCLQVGTFLIFTAALTEIKFPFTPLLQLQQAKLD